MEHDIYADFAPQLPPGYESAFAPGDLPGYESAFAPGYEAVIPPDAVGFFENIFLTLGRHDNHVLIVAVYLLFAAAIILLRIAAHVHFHGILLSFASVPEMKTMASTEKIKCAVLKKAAAEYIRVAERAVTAVPTSSIVERAIASMGLFGWKYTGILPLVETMEIGTLGVGLVLAIIFPENAAVYGLLAIISFAVFRLTAAFFDVRAARNRLSNEMVLFIERELGRFFASDTGGALLRLKGDLTDAIDRQAAAYKATMDAIAAKMHETFKEVSQSMVGAANSIGPIVAAAMDEKLINMNDTLIRTLHNWEDALKKAAEVQAATNAGAERFSRASTRIQSASDLLSTHMQGHSNALSEQLITLVAAIDEMKTEVEALTASQAALTKQSAVIERNQQALETSLNLYEASLQNLTQSIGDGMGAFINLHAQTAAQTINDAMRNNIDRILNLAGGKD